MRKFRLDVREKSFTQRVVRPWHSIESCGCLIPGASQEMLKASLDGAPSSLSWGGGWTVSPYQGAGAGWTFRFLPTQAILWFYESQDGCDPMVTARHAPTPLIQHLPKQLFSTLFPHPYQSTIDSVDIKAVLPSEVFLFFLQEPNRQTPNHHHVAFHSPPVPCSHLAKPGIPEETAHQKCDIKWKWPLTPA